MSIEITAETNKFAGFPAPTRNFFSLPNEITDIIAGITNLSELKILIYVIRHTWGYREFGISKAITNDEFMYGRKHSDGTRMDRGTGLSEQGVRDGTNKAVKDGYLICDIDDSDKGRIRKSYRLKMLEVKTLDPQTLDLSQSRGLESAPPTSETSTSGQGTLDPRPRKRRPRTEKDTSEIHSGNTPLKERDDPPPSSSPEASPSFDSSFDLNNSQGGATPPPLGDKGVPSSESRLRIAPRLDISSPEMPVVHVDQSSGYKTDDSVEASDNVAVMENSTAEVTEALVMSWLKTLEQEEVDEKRVKHFSIGRIAGDEEAMARLLSAVHGLDGVRGLYRTVRGQQRFRDGRIIYGLNLTSVEAIRDWLQSRRPAINPALQPFTEATRNDLMREIQAKYKLWVQAPPADPELGLILLIWHGDEEYEYMLIQCRADWEGWRDDPLLERALAYADCVLSREQEQEQQLEAVAL